MDTCKHPWLVAADRIEPGAPADLGRPSLFFAVHSIALAGLGLSFFGSVAVIFDLVSYRVPTPTWLGIKAARHPSRPSRSLSDRMTLSAALADVAWCCASAADHLVLLVSNEFPQRDIGTILELASWICFGYSQLLRAALSLATFLRVCRKTRINLGSWDLVLNLVCFCLGTAIGLLLHVAGGLGPTGFWSMSNIHSPAGIVASVLVWSVASANAVLTSMCNRAMASKISASTREIRECLMSSSKLPEPPAASVTSSATVAGAGGSEGKLIGSNTRSGSGDKTGIARQRTLEVVSSAISSSSPSSLDIPAANGMPPWFRGWSSPELVHAGSGETRPPTTKAATSSSGTVVATWRTAVAVDRGPSVRRALVATQCLHNLSWTTALVNTPLAVASFLVVVFHAVGALEPVTCFCFVIAASCSGLANAVAYLMNVRLKASIRRRASPQ
ncbi:hypothetical protein H9P43_003033 [Blastocladiella emersonii ATCC 22665]|nr:hypothetical protein H9P43_003033 [Blastocladiella emersonii ATCC 22665]